MLTGKIKVWNRSNGWGFVEGDDGEDYLWTGEIGQSSTLNSDIAYFAAPLLLYLAQ